MSAELANEAKRFARDPDKRRAWELYGQGLSQREIAPLCQHQQAWVSRLLDEKRRATAVALDAATALRRHPDFAKACQTPSGAERLVEALRNHLLEAERKGDLPPLRRWVQHHLSS